MSQLILGTNEYAKLPTTSS